MLWKTFVRWAVVAIAVPVAVAVIRSVSRSIEAKRGSTRGSVFLNRVADTVDRVTGRAPQRQVTSRA